METPTATPALEPAPAPVPTKTVTTPATTESDTITAASSSPADSVRVSTTVKASTSDQTMTPQDDDSNITIITPADDEDVFEVERILKKKNHPTRGVLYYVKWKNFPPSANTWEPACNFSHKLIEIYESTRRTKRRKISHDIETTSQASSTATTTATSLSSNGDDMLINNGATTTSETTSSKTAAKMNQIAAPANSPLLPKQITFEPKLCPPLPVCVTDVTANGVTVTLSECEPSRGFFMDT